MRHSSLQIRKSSIGGYAVRSPFERRARVLAAINAVFHWMGA